MVKVRGSDTEFPLYTLEPRNIGNAAVSIAASVGETDIDLQIGSHFYPKALSVVFSITNTSDYLEFFLLDETGTKIVKKLGSTHYIAATTDNIDFANNRDAIPRIIYPLNNRLRIAFQNKSATAYTVTSAWDVWVPTAFG